MNKSKIEWCDYTWNPVTGCFHTCDYCYARRQSKRFAGQLYPNKVYATENCGLALYKSTGFGFYENYSIDKPVKNEDGRIIPYPFGFKPTFHRYRLDEPQKVKKPSRIFVSSMGDLFGEWVPTEWIEEVFKACKAAPEHTFLFLTKNPSRYMDLYCNGIEFPENTMLGTTITGETDIDRQYWIPVQFKTFVSIEPLIEPIKSNLLVDWVIVGEMTGPRATKPEPEWVQSIINYCKKWSIPVFVKSPLYEKFPIQEWPKDMTKGVAD